MIDDIKLLLGLTSEDKDELIELLIKLATQSAKQITNTDNTSKLKNVICKMVVYDYNRLGTEGLDSESYSGSSYSYSSDYPDSILKELEAIKKANKDGFKILW